MRLGACLAILAVSGCVGQTVPSNPVPGDLAQQAYFATFPDTLFAAAALSCTAPGQTVVRPSATEIRCESLPDPQTAAAIILGFDGSVREIPRIVFAFAAQPATDGGYIVSADSYLRVLQNSGQRQIVRFPDAVVQSDLRDILRSAGGQSL